MPRREGRHQDRVQPGPLQGSQEADKFEFSDAADLRRGQLLNCLRMQPPMLV
jgi:hypothetical protein